MKSSSVAVAVSTAFAISLLSASAAEANPPIPRPQDMSEDEYWELVEEGGKIERAGSGYGLVQIVNRQNKVGVKAYDKAIARIQFDVNVHIAVVSAPTNAQITVEVVDDPTSSRALAVFPDEQRSVVNIAPLAADSPTAERLAERLQKEVVRAFAYVGGITGGGKGTLFGAMSGLGSLDSAPLDIPGDYVMRCTRYLESVGVKEYFKTSYLNACQQGWAPKPVNVWQKAVWDRVHQKPTKGIKIKYDPNKGE